MKGEKEGIRRTKQDKKEITERKRKKGAKKKIIKKKN
jgi:hypothetical protein